MTYAMTPIGTVSNERTDIQNTDHWGAVISKILVEPWLGEECLRGLAEFSHVEVIFVFDRMEEREDYRARSPRGRSALPEVGVFAERGPRRPNRIGTTTCPIVAVGERELTVRGLDATSGTPVLDLKPVIAEFQSGTDVRQPAWVAEIMGDYFRP